MTVQLLAAAETAGQDRGNLLVGLVIGIVAVIGAICWLAYRYRVARRPAPSRSEHETLREVHGQRPEQKAVQDETDVKYLRRSGF